MDNNASPPSDSEGSGFWQDNSSRLMDLVFNYAGARLSREVNPPPPPYVPPPTRPGLSIVRPGPAISAQTGDVGQMIAEIFASPKTWMALGAVALVVVLVKMRR